MAITNEPFRVARACEVDGDSPHGQEFVVMRSEFYVCTVHGGGIDPNDVEGERAAQLICDALNRYAFLKVSFAP